MKNLEYKLFERKNGEIDIIDVFDTTCFYTDIYEKKYIVSDDKTYYLKSYNLNELIGEELSNQFGIESVHYYICKCNNIDYFISKDFKKDNCTYKTPREFHLKSDYCKYGYTKLKAWEKELNDDFNYKYLLEQIFKMSAIDFYMCQNDRCDCNVTMEIFDTGFISLAPLYDFSYSFFEPEISIDNPFIQVLNCHLHYFFNEYPEAFKHFKKLMDIDLENILKKIVNNYDIIISNEEMEKYLKFDKDVKTKKIARILN